MRLTKLFIITIICSMLLLAGCIKEKKVVEVETETDILKNLDMKDGDVYFEFYNKIKGYSLVRDKIIKEDEGIDEETLLLKGLDAGNYNIIFKYNDKTGEIKKSNAYNFIVKDNTNEVVINSVTYKKNNGEKLEIETNLSSNSKSEIYVKKIEIQAIDSQSNCVNYMFDFTQAEKPFIIENGVDKVIPVYAGLDIAGKVINMELKVIGCSEDNREVRVLSYRQIPVLMYGNSTMKINAETSKNDFIEGDIINTFFQLTESEPQEILITYGGNIKKIFAQPNEKYSVEFIAEKNYNLIVFSDSKNIYKLEKKIEVKSCEGIMVDIVIPENIINGEEFIAELSGQDYAGNENISVVFDKKINLMSSDMGKYYVKPVEAGITVIKMFYKNTLIETKYVEIKEKASIKFEKISVVETVNKIEIMGLMKVYTDKLYRFKGIEIIGEITVLENKSIECELISAVKNDAEINIIFNKYTNISKGEIYLLYEEVESKTMTRERIF